MTHNGHVNSLDGSIGREDFLHMPFGDVACQLADVEFRLVVKGQAHASVSWVAQMVSLTLFGTRKVNTFAHIDIHTRSHYISKYYQYHHANVLWVEELGSCGGGTENEIYCGGGGIGNRGAETPNDGFRAVWETQSHAVWEMQNRAVWEMQSRDAWGMRNGIC